jgi:hypothetical protein
VLQAVLDLADHRYAAAAAQLTSAIATFRDGDYLVELAEALTVSTEHARLTGNLDAAGDHVDEVLDITVPRALRPFQIRALAGRARTSADRFAASREADELHRGRDAADAAVRQATGSDPLPWHELEALEAHVHLDRVERVDRGWAQRAANLRRRLIPDGLDPDPVATIEAEIAERPQPDRPEWG